MGAKRRPVHLISGIGIVEKATNYNEVNKEKIEYRKREMEKMRKFGETQLIVATLIATVTFAAGFTLPGGYDGNEGPNQGMAVLIKKAAFKSFVASDAVAVASSLFSVFLLFTAALSTSLNDDDDDDDDRETMAKFAKPYLSAMVFLVIAKIGMVIAFVTGVYTTLDEGSLGLAISICCLGRIFLIFIFYKLHRVVPLQLLIRYVWDVLLKEWREGGLRVWKVAAKAFVDLPTKLMHKLRPRS